MGVEIERKFLVRGDGWRRGQPVQMRQGYLNRDKERTVRVRVAGQKGFLTIKGITRGATRAEFEYAIPVTDALQLLNFCDGPLVEKTRYTLPVSGTTWEIDEFHGMNEGLVVAEVELATEDQRFERPEWLGEEVTEDARYLNSSLAVRPYSTWRE